MGSFFLSFYVVRWKRENSLKADVASVNCLVFLPVMVHIFDIQ